MTAIAISAGALLPSLSPMGACIRSRVATPNLPMRASLNPGRYGRSGNTRDSRFEEGTTRWRHAGFKHGLYARLLWILGLDHLVLTYTSTATVFTECSEAIKGLWRSLHRRPAQASEPRCHQAARQLRCGSCRLWELRHASALHLEVSIRCRLAE